MNKQTSDTLVQVFTRAPVPGEVKTRLIPELGEERAAELHETLTKRIVGELITTGIDAELWCASDADHPFFAQFGLISYQQQGEGLGHRMAFALSEGLTRADKVVLVGTDLPPIDASYVGNAFASLEHHRVVLGPAMDGGYGLVGVSGGVPDIFEDISWGTSEVLSQTCERLNQQRLDYSLLPLIWDVDTPEDIVRYRNWTNGQGEA